VQKLSIPVKGRSELERKLHYPLKKITLPTKHRMRKNTDFLFIDESFISLSINDSVDTMSR
jgi:hypothetical protein